jgi:hypothetical protein
MTANTYDTDEPYDGLVSLFEEAMRAVHDHHEECSDPDFGEASRDYAHAALALLDKSREGVVGFDTEPSEASVHRVCELIREGGCKGCPRRDEIDGELRGCFLQAQECVNTVETGNPWRKVGEVCAPFVSAKPQGVVGWKLVPVEPTKEMLDAADAAVGEWRKSLTRDEAMMRSYMPPGQIGEPRKFIASATPEEKHALRYRAMLVAAPPPPVGGAS